MKKKCIFGLLLLMLGAGQIFAAACGDVNSTGAADIVDALMIAQYYVGLNPQNFDQSVGDVNGDGSINIIDALQVAQYYVGLIDSFTGCSATPTPPQPTGPPLEPETVFAVNCGGDSYTATDGTLYQADTGYSGGSTYSNEVPISGTSDQSLYVSERYGASTYTIPVPNGSYLVTLHFAETYHTEAGLRRFNVLMEGTAQITNLDIYAEAGSNTAYFTESEVTVSDGALNVEFVTTVENAKVNAIKVSALSYTGEPVVSFTVNPIYPKPGEEVTVDASASFDPDGVITGYSVDYGDGYKTTGAVTTHRYTNENEYTITVTLTDNEGRTNSLSKSISVTTAFNPCPLEGDCRILPLGDSITNGYHGPSGGYRVPLFRKANSEGKHITFVGSLANGPATVDGVPFPKNHQGHVGYYLVPIVENAPAPSQGTTPHIVLMMGGTNDVRNSSGAKAAPENANIVLETLFRLYPDALIVMAKIPPMSSSGWNSAAITFNATLPATVNKHASAGKHVVLVDMHTGFPTSGLADGVHPNETGCEHIANVWYEAINMYLR